LAYRTHGAAFSAIKLIETGQTSSRRLISAGGAAPVRAARFMSSKTDASIDSRQDKFASREHNFSSQLINLGGKNARCWIAQ
jgi:hypothetical protein